MRAPRPIQKTTTDGSDSNQMRLDTQLRQIGVSDRFGFRKSEGFATGRVELPRRQAVRMSALGTLRSPSGHPLRLAAAFLYAL